MKKLELKQYRNMVGKFNWLAQSTRPDLCYTSLRVAKRNNEAKISYLKNINFVLKKVKERSSKMFYMRIGNKDCLEIVGIEDASYKYNEHPINRELASDCHSDNN